MNAWTPQHDAHVTEAWIDTLRVVANSHVTEYKSHMRAARYKAEKKARGRKTVSLDAKAVQLVRDIAERRGVSLPVFLEALMHYAISQDERPGSWEAQGFDFANYGEGGFADRWF
jgi:hypothetical protein